MLSSIGFQIKNKLVVSPGNDPGPPVFQAGMRPLHQETIIETPLGEIPYLSRAPVPEPEFVLLSRSASYFSNVEYLHH